MKRSLPHINWPTRVVASTLTALGAAAAVLVGTMAAPATTTASSTSSAALPRPGAHVPGTAPARTDPLSYRYGWPVKPFRAQHPVRGFFGDPRIGNYGRSRQFHFGIDISAPNGTPVYATLTGRVWIHPLHRTTVAVVGRDGTEFSYWHVVPTVRTGQRAVAYRTVIGHVQEPYAHVHFSEARDGRYVNPLRPGALGPFVDETTPFVVRVTAEHGGRRLPSSEADGEFELVTEVGDETPLAIPRPWFGLPVMPALVRWRLVTATGRTIRGWHTVVDFRQTIPSASEFDRVWAPGTTQNHVRSAGHYRLFLARGLDLQAGSYVVEVAARDTRGNHAVSRVALVARRG
jgi:hypothetical protein